MKFIIVALALMAMFSTASAFHCDNNNGGCSHDCRLAGNGEPICGCPDKWSLQPDGHNCVKNAGSDCEAETTDLTQLLHNNLKGFGPDKGVPESMVFGDFLTLEDGTLVNLEVTAEDGYTPLKVRYNGVAPGGEFGQIGIKTGSDVSLIFKLLNKKTGKKIDKLPKIEITWYDLDTQWNNANAQESVKFCGATGFKLSEGTTVRTTNHHDGCAQFSAQEYGGFKNNPTTRDELDENHMNHAVTAIFKNRNEFTSTLHSTPAPSGDVSRQFIFSIDVYFCEEPRCVTPITRPERYLEIAPIVGGHKSVPGMYFQYNKKDAENFFETRPKWDYFGQHMMINSCGEYKMLTMIRDGENCDVFDDKLQCGRITGDAVNQELGGDWNYEDFDTENHKRWIAWLPGEEPKERKCVDVVKPARHLTITPVTGPNAIEEAMYFTFNQKKAQTFFGLKPNWKYSGSNIPMINSCGEPELLTIIRNGRNCNNDNSKIECGRITGAKAGFDDWNYVHSAGVSGERWIAFPEDVHLPESDVGQHWDPIGQHLKRGYAAEEADVGIRGYAAEEADVGIRGYAAEEADVGQHWDPIGQHLKRGYAAEEADVGGTESDQMGSFTKFAVVGLLLAGAGAGGYFFGTKQASKGYDLVEMSEAYKTFQQE